MQCAECALPPGGAPLRTVRFRVVVVFLAAGAFFAVLRVEAVGWAVAAVSAASVVGSLSSM